MKLSAAVSMGLFLLPEMATAAGGFYNSCKSNVGSLIPPRCSPARLRRACPLTTALQWHIERGYYMVAECRRNNGSYRKTSQNLNLCVANYKGKLASANK
jgi:hypothetical protein